MDGNIFKLALTANKLLGLDNLERIVHHLINRGLVILPTETGYLLAANALDEEAVRKVFTVKNRPINNPIHVVVSSIEMAERYIELSPYARKIIYRFLPGPVTPICPKKDVVSDFLVANTGYLGIRIPDSSIALQVVNALDKPITATSLNVSGDSSKKNLEDVIEEINWSNQIVYCVKQDDIIKYDKPSTLVKISGKRFAILREGPVSEKEISDAFNHMYYSEVEDWT